MKIRVWNAYASNNSGSYTIVGSFRSADAARAVTAEIAELIAAHAAWFKAQGNAAPAPIEQFAQANRLRYDAEVDDWPQYGDKEAPDVFCVGSQVVVHHDYTVTLPTVFGELFFKRGGRVDVELNHAHHPVVAVFELWIPWEKRPGLDVAAARDRLLVALIAPEGAVLAACREAPVRHTSDTRGEFDITFAAVFEDLLTGFTAVAAVAEKHGFALRVRICEAWSEEDPLSFLR